jgi:hypothetical protein
MAKVYPKKNPDNELKLEEIADAIASAQVFERYITNDVYLVFVYAGTARQCRIKNREIEDMNPHGYRAMRVAEEVLAHVLRNPNDYLPRDLMLRVLIGND